MPDGSGRDCGPVPSVRDERALQGCVTRVGRGLAPEAFAFRIGGIPFSRSLSPRLATTALAR
jgi:hypothetical protein